MRRSARSIILAAAPIAVVFGIRSCVGGIQTVCLAPPPAQDPPKICRWDPLPAGWIAVDFVDDHSDCPTVPGQKLVYTRVILESLHQKTDVCLNMCAGQKLPEMWAPVGEGRDPAICPREPGDTTEGPTYFVIQARADL
jgi:hypothetical protein